MKIDKNTTVAQSKNAYNQWAPLWREHAKTHSKFAPFRPLSDFLNIGVGKACLLVANGFSFEEHIETIKLYQHHVDILCCDKTLGHLLRHGIKPTYCLVADAVVSYEKYCEPYKDQLQDTILFATVTCNPKWTDEQNNWKKRYFFANTDVIHSELEFSKLSGCPNRIPAATNVSNAMVVFLTQSDNTGRRNFFGYDKLLLIGFDYSWRYGGKYYAFDEDGNGKANYMRHVYCVTKGGTYAYSSTNLLYSARWLEQYIKGFKLPVVQCCQETVLSIPYSGDLAKQMQYEFRRGDATFVREELEKRDKLIRRAQDIEQRVIQIGTEHYYNFVGSL